MWNWIKNSQRGLALVTVLWVLVLLSLMAASFTKTTRTEVNVMRAPLYAAIRPALTVYNGKGDIDPAVAVTRSVAPWSD